MHILFKRSQSTRATAISFRLNARLELSEEEKQIVRKYKFDQSVLIFEIQPNLFRQSVALGLIAFAALYAAYLNLVPYQTKLQIARELDISTMGMLTLCGLSATLIAYLYYHDNRETIYVKDLLHGRGFKCRSVIELARKEAYLETITAYLRQVMESAKHWGGTESREINPLPKDEARRVILKGPLL